MKGVGSIIEAFVQVAGIAAGLLREVIMPVPTVALSSAFVSVQGLAHYFIVLSSIGLVASSHFWKWRRRYQAGLSMVCFLLAVGSAALYSRYMDNHTRFVGADKDARVVLVADVAQVREVVWKKNPDLKKANLLASRDVETILNRCNNNSTYVWGPGVLDQVRVSGGFLYALVGVFLTWSVLSASFVLRDAL